MKKYELTQEQINQLAEKKHAKELLKEFIPEAFEKQLEVGKVYKYLSIGEGKFMFKFNGFGVNNYGFNIIGQWSDNLGVWENAVNLYEEATKEEWLEALKKEAKRRGFKKGVKYNYADKPYLIRRFKDKLHLGDLADLVDDFNNILRDGIWAEVIKEEIPTQEEIGRVINYLKNK